VGVHWDSDGNPEEPGSAGLWAAFDLSQVLEQFRMVGGPSGDASLVNGRPVTADDLEKYVTAYSALSAAGENVGAIDQTVIKQAETILNSEQTS
jgi:hypothetical protein